MTLHTSACWRTGNLSSFGRKACNCALTVSNMMVVNEQIDEARAIDRRAVRANQHQRTILAEVFSLSRALRRIFLAVKTGKFSRLSEGSEKASRPRRFEFRALSRARRARKGASSKQPTCMVHTALVLAAKTAVAKPYSTISLQSSQIDLSTMNFGTWTCRGLSYDRCSLLVRCWNLCKKKEEPWNEIWVVFCIVAMVPNTTLALPAQM